MEYRLLPEGDNAADAGADDVEAGAGNDTDWCIWGGLCSLVDRSPIEDTESRRGGSLDDPGDV